MTATLTAIPTATATTVRGSQLRAALTAATLSADKGGRTCMVPILAAVRITRVGAKLTVLATDRYRLTRAIIPVDMTGQLEEFDGNDFAVTIPVADVARVLALVPRPAAKLEHFTLTLEVDELGTLVATGWDGSTVRVVGMTEEYPRVDSLITGLTPVEPTDRIGFDPRLLADIAKMPGLNRNVFFDLRGATKPVTATWSDDGVDYLHLLMPVRESR